MSAAQLRAFGERHLLRTLYNMSDNMMKLLQFVETGDIEKVEEYTLRYGVPVDSKWTDYLLLRTAVRKNHVDLTQFLIEQGCRVLKTVKLPINTLLHIAVENKSEEMINLLLENGASFTHKNQAGDTPLTSGIKSMIESKSVDIYILDMLLKNCADINTCTKDGTTLLHFATRHLDEELVEYLIQHKADVNCVDKRSGDSPLHIAAKKQYYEIAKILLKHGADITQKNDDGQSPLHIAVHIMYKDMIDAMIRWNQNDVSKFLNQVDNFGCSHFHAVCICNNSSLVSTLLSKGEEVNQTVKEDSPKWPFYTPMSFAMISKSEEAVRALLLFDAIVHPSLGKTVLHLAVEYMSKEVVDVILESGVDVNACTKSGKSPLHIAVNRGNLAIIKMLIKYKADVNCASKKDGKTPLHLAVIKAHFEIVRVLLKEGADAKAKTTNGATALHLLAQGICSKKIELKFVKSCSNIVQFLIDAGCDINAPSSNGYTPLCYARRYMCASSACALLQHGADIDLMNEKEKQSKKLTKIFDEHTVKLRILKLSTNLANLNIDDNQSHDNVTSDGTEENKFLEKYVQQFGKYEFYGKIIGSDFAQRCVAELNRMKATLVDRYTSLFNIIFKDSTAMSFHSINKSFKHMLDSKEFDKSFPLYGYLVKLQLKKGIIRKKFINPAKNSLDILARLNLPDSCSESVIKYLNNDDLTNLISATASSD